MLRLTLTILISVCLSTVGSAQNYTSPFCGRTITFQEGEDIVYTFTYDTNGSGMNGMNGPIRRPVRARSVTTVKDDIKNFKSSAIDLDSNYVNIGTFTTTAPDCGADGLITFTFEWENPTESPEWAMFSNDDGQSIVLSFGDYTPTINNNCDDSGIFNTENSFDSENIYNGDCLVTFQISPASSVSPIPTLSEWGLIILAVFFMIIGLIGLRVKNQSFLSKA